MPLQPIKIWGHWGAPNPWKVCMVFEAMNLPYEITLMELNEVKQEAYLKVNPNGRLPTIEDPNTGVTLWEVRRSSRSMRMARISADGIVVRCHHPIPGRPV